MKQFLATLLLLSLLLICPLPADDVIPVQKPTLFVVSAKWCPQCVVFQREYMARRSQLRQTMESRYIVVVLDADNDINKRYLSRHRITNLPTFVFAHDPANRRVVGYSGRSALLQSLERELNED